MTNAQEVEQSPFLDHAVRFGLIAYGVVHLIVAWLALQLAFGDSEGKASNQGALHQLAQGPFGKVLVIAIAVGMFLLVIWRLIEAGFGHREEEGGKRWAKRAASLGKAVIYGALGFSAAKVAIGAKSGGGGSDAMTAKLMSLPFGVWLVGLTGLAIIGYGIFSIVRGWSEKFAENLDAEGKSGKSGSAYIMLGKVGYIAKGIAIGLVGGLFCYAALTHDPDKSGGLDQALKQVLEQPFGRILLAAIALGLAGYGLFCFARARHLSR